MHHIKTVLTIRSVYPQLPEKKRKEGGGGGCVGGLLEQKPKRLGKLSTRPCEPDPWMQIQ